MSEFIDQDLTGSTFRRTALSGSRLHQVKFEDADCRRVWLNRTEFRGVMMHGTKFLGAEMLDVVINGELRNVVINGVEVSAYIEAELNRQSPERALMHPTDPAGFRQAWDLLEQKWAETIERARASRNRSTSTSRPIENSSSSLPSSAKNWAVGRLWP